MIRLTPPHRHPRFGAAVPVRHLVRPRRAECKQGGYGGTAPVRRGRVAVVAGGCPPAPSRRFRLCVIRGATDAVEEEAKANFEQALTVLGKVADIEEVTLPDLPYAAVNRTINLAESASAFEEFLETGQLAELSVQSNRGAVYARASVLATDYLRALRLRGLIAKGIDDLLDGYDALVSPTRSGVALPLDEEFPVAGNDVIGPMGNVAGLPAISVPNGFGEHGLPTGVQFMGRAYGENDILAVARTYQSLTSWHTMHPSDLVPSG